MSAKEQVKKPSKVPTAPAAVHSPQTAPAVAEHEEERPEIATQLEGAARLGHSLGAVGVDAPAQHVLQRQGLPPEGEEEEFGEEDIDERRPVLQRQVQPEEGQVGPQGGQVPPGVEAAIRRARGGGQPLEGALQEQMSANLGHDFKGVRVHTGPEADELNQHLQARAFTTGADIFFRRGEYAPGSSGGRELITHELTHVVQQSSGQIPADGVGNGMTVRPAGDTFEQKADARAQGMSGHLFSEDCAVQREEVTDRPRVTGKVKRESIIQRKFGLEIELDMLLTSDHPVTRNLRKQNGDIFEGHEKFRGEPVTRKYPVVADEGKDYEVHVDHNKAFQVEEPIPGEGDVPPLWVPEGPIVELVTKPWDENLLTEDAVRAKMGKLSTFAETAARGLDQGEPAKRVLKAAPQNLYLGHPRKRSLNPTDGKVQTTYGVRIDRIGEMFDKHLEKWSKGRVEGEAGPDVEAGEQSGVEQRDIPQAPPLPQSAGSASRLEPSQNALVEAKRNARQVLERLSSQGLLKGMQVGDVPELEGLLILISGYLRAGKIQIGSQWLKNRLGHAFYKSQLSSVFRELPKQQRKIVQSNLSFFIGLLLEINERQDNEQVVLPTRARTSEGEIEEVGGSTSKCKPWLEGVLKGKKDSIFEEARNQYASELKPERPRRKDPVRVIMENRHLIENLPGSRKAEEWPEIAATVWRVLREINIGTTVPAPPREKGAEPQKRSSKRSPENPNAPYSEMRDL